LKTAKPNISNFKDFKRTLLEWIAIYLAELKVAEEFWDFLGGEGAYNELLDCFERVGIELRPEIDEYFEKFK